MVSRPAILRAGEVRRRAAEGVRVEVRGEDPVEALGEGQQIRAHAAARVPGNPIQTGAGEALRAMPRDGGRRGLLGALRGQEGQRSPIEPASVLPR